MKQKTMDFQGKHNFSEENLDQLKGWFSGYVRLFYSANPALRMPLKLKEDHSLRVCAAIMDIGRRLSLDEVSLRIAEATALFHDIGRFEQISRYGTFVDRKSEDHASLGVRVLRQEAVLASLDEAAGAIILKSISYHNRLMIPEGETPACVFFSRLLRDADKLDILNLFSHYYYLRPEERNSAVELDLPDRPEVSEDVLAALQEGRAVNSGQMRTLNDFKLLQMAWVYDINFRPSLQIIRKQGYLEKIRDTLPVSDRIARVYAAMMSFMESRLSGSGMEDEIHRPRQHARR